MRGRLSSLTRRIRNAVETWGEFARKSEEKQKQSPSDALFSQPNSNENKKTRFSSQFVRF